MKMKALMLVPALLLTSMLASASDCPDLTGTYTYELTGSGQSIEMTLTQKGCLVVGMVSKVPGQEQLMSSTLIADGTFRDIDGEMVAGNFTKDSLIVENVTSASSSKPGSSSVTVVTLNGALNVVMETVSYDKNGNATNRSTTVYTRKK